MRRERQSMLLHGVSWEISFFCYAHTDLCLHAVAVKCQNTILFNNYFAGDRNFTHFVSVGSRGGRASIAAGYGFGGAKGADPSAAGERMCCTLLG